eukprot:322085_1
MATYTAVIFAVINFRSISAICPCCEIPNPACDEVSACQDNGLLFPVNLLDAYDDLEQQLQYLDDSFHLGCNADGGASYDGSYGRCSGDDDIANAVMHSLFTALIAKHSHSDTLGCGKGCAKDKALHFMQAREDCLDSTSSLMDMHNNIIGANVFYNNVYTECTFAIGYIFGSVCVIRSEKSASSRKLAEDIMMLYLNAEFCSDQHDIFVADSNDLVYIKRCGDCPVNVDILGAAYGNLDVKDVVKQYAEIDGIYNIPAANSVFGDPWRGVKKSLVIVYELVNYLDESLGFGVEFMSEGGILKITNVVTNRDSISNIFIIGAVYGLQEVTQQVQRMVDDGETIIYAKNSVFGDSWRGVSKTLVVVYKSNGQIVTQICKENSSILF